MINTLIMNEKEAEHYISQINRKAEFNNLSDEQRELRKAEDEGLMDYLKENLCRYLLFYLWSKQEILFGSVFEWALQGWAKSTKVNQQLIQALANGNVENFSGHCYLFLLCYHRAMENLKPELLSDFCINVE